MSKPKRRRRWSADQKLKIVLETLQSERKLSEICRREGLSPTQVYQWRRQRLGPGDPVYGNSKRSVGTFGYLQPIIVNRRTDTVVGGHQRLTVLRDLGYEKVDVVFVDLSVEQEKALNLTLNKTVGAWDEPKLAQLLAEFEGFPDFDVQLTGFDDGEISDLISRVLDRKVQAGNDHEFDVEGALDETRPAVTQAGELIA